MFSSFFGSWSNTKLVKDSKLKDNRLCDLDCRHLAALQLDSLCGESFYHETFNVLKQFENLTAERISFVDTTEQCGIKVDDKCVGWHQIAGEFSCPDYCDMPTMDVMYAYYDKKGEQVGPLMQYTEHDQMVKFYPLQNVWLLCDLIDDKTDLLCTVVVTNTGPHKDDCLIWRFDSAGSKMIMSETYKGELRVEIVFCDGFVNEVAYYPQCTAHTEHEFQVGDKAPDVQDEILCALPQ